MMLRRCALLLHSVGRFEPRESVTCSGALPDARVCAGCDVLWGGCPIVTLPLERMASRVAASLCYATGLGAEMVVSSQQVQPLRGGTETSLRKHCVNLESPVTWAVPESFGALEALCLERWLARVPHWPANLLRISKKA